MKSPFRNDFDGELDSPYMAGQDVPAGQPVSREYPELILLVKSIGSRGIFLEGRGGMGTWVSPVPGPMTTDTERGIPFDD
jgi:hypothetical protein